MCACSRSVAFLTEIDDFVNARPTLMSGLEIVPYAREEPSASTSVHSEIRVDGRDWNRAPRSSPTHRDASLNAAIQATILRVARDDRLRQPLVA